MRCIIINIQSIRNFRDAGGLTTAKGKRIRTGLLYRSGDLADASPEDLATLADLGIKTIVDLRTDAETKRHPDRLPPVKAVQHLLLPIKVSYHDDSGPARQILSHFFGNGRNRNYFENMRNSYEEYATDFYTLAADVIKLTLQKNNLPMLIHCTAGKDRTGFLISLIQRALGVPQDQVLEHYMSSNNSIHAFQEMMRKRYHMFSFLKTSFEKFTPLMEVHHEYLQAAYNLIDSEYGSLDTYLQEKLGLTVQEQTALEAVFLESGTRNS